MLEFNKENFSKLKNMVLEYNNNHEKANLKDLELKLKKSLLVVSSLGLITVATGCSINLDQTTLENVIESELFQDNKDIVEGAEKVDVYEQSEAVMDALESVGILLEDEPEQIEELTYEEFKETVEDVANIINERKIDVLHDSFWQMQDKKTNPISYTDQVLTEREKELIDDYYAIREYVEQNQSQDYQKFYNNVLSTKIHELFVEEGINNVLVTDVSYNDGEVLIKVNVDDEVIKLKASEGSDLEKIIASMDQENYENFKDEINDFINEGLFIIKTRDGDECEYIQSSDIIEGGLICLAGTVAIAVASTIHTIVKNRKKQNKKR